MRGRLITLIAFGLRHLLGARKVIIAALLAMVPATLALVVRTFAPPGAIDSFLRQGLPSVLMAICGLMSLFTGSGCVRDLVEERTLPLLLTRPIGRARLCSGLLLAALIASVVFAVVATGSAYAVASAGDVLVSRVPSPWRLMFTMGVLAALHTLLFAVVGLQFRRSTIVSVVLLGILDAGIGSAPGPLRRIAPTAIAEGLLGEEWTTRTSQLSPRELFEFSEQAALVMLVAEILMLSVWFRRRARRMDFLSAEVSSSGN
jgi:ABC-type transport system involved in multi-copper enzyme maturation permease subunit